MNSIEVFVSVKGDDAASGTKTEPLETLAGARDAVRTLRKSAGSRPAEVHIASGFYELTETLALTAEDSNVTWRADGDVRISGGRIVRGWHRIADESVLKRLTRDARQNVLECNLRDNGVADFGHIARSGFALKERLSHLELFINGQPMRLAEWPNQDWTTIASLPKAKPLVDSSGKRRGSDVDRFHYSGARPSNWASMDDVWVHGYWCHDWADAYLPIASLDTASRTIVIEPPQSRYGYKKGQRFRFINVLEELDSPGEFHVDRKTGMLRVWPVEPIEEAAVSILSKPLVTMTDVSRTRFIGMTFEHGRNTAIEIRGGEGVEVAGCRINNFGHGAVSVSGGRANTVRSCDISNLGAGGITLTGGDRKTLAPSKHVADNNHIHHIGRWIRTYQVGVGARGVGQVIRHNLISDAPHAGIIYSGNDHIIEFNEFTRLCMASGDVGGTYCGRDWSARGTIIRHNYFHDLGGLNMGSNAVYLDDCASGQIIVGNVFQNVWRGLMIGGGRDNVIEDNVFVGYKVGIHFDARGIGWARPLIEGGKGGWNIVGRLDAVPWNKEPYASRYPTLPGLLDDTPIEPRGNRIARNIFVGENWLHLVRITMEQIEQGNWATIENNLTDADPRFVDEKAGDFRLRDDSPAHALGFKPIPFDKIGLQVDQYRSMSNEK